MLLGSEIGAALTALEPLGIDLIGLNCATGPAEMSEHLRYLARHARVAARLHAQRRAARSSTARRRALPADARGAGRRARHRSPATTACRWSAAAAAPRPSTCARSSSGSAAGAVHRAAPQPEPGVASLYQHVPFRQDTSYLSIGERTNANGSKAFREAMLAGDWDDCVEIARGADPRRRAPARPVSVDYVGRDGVADMSADRRPLRHRLDAADRARLHRARRAARPAWSCSAAAPSSTRSTTRTATGPTRRFARIMPMVREHGAAVVALTIDEEGQARTAEWKVRGRRPAHRRPDRAAGGCGSRTSSSTA